MTVNLRKELVTFQERVKNNQGGVRIAQRSPSAGGGALGLLELLLTLGLLGVRRLRGARY